MKNKRMHIYFLLPEKNEKFILDKVTVWLLLFSGEENVSELEEKYYKKEKCTYEKFISI